MTVQPLNIGAAIRAMRQKAEREEAERLAERERAWKQEVNKRSMEFEVWLRKVFSPALTSALNYTIANSDHDNWIVFEYEGMAFEGRWQRDRLAVTTRPESMHKQAWNDETMLQAIATVYDHFIIAREQQATQEAAAAAALLAAQQAHERCTARVAQAKAASVPWIWPAGRELTIYRWSWCTAPASADGSAEHDGGYNLQNDLGPMGDIAVYPQRYQKKGRVVVVRYATPIAEQITVRSIADLPDDLRVPRQIHLPGIRHNYRCQDENGDPTLSDDEEDAVLQIDLGGEWPITWVRDALLNLK